MSVQLFFCLVRARVSPGTVSQVRVKKFVIFVNSHVKLISEEQRRRVMGDNDRESKEQETRITSVIRKLKRNFSSPSSMLYPFVFGLIITLSLSLQKNDIIGPLIFLFVTLLFGVRALQLIVQMEKAKKKLSFLCISLGTVLAASAIFFIHVTYFFNPLTFKNTPFLYESWNTYKSPLSMEISGGSRPVKIVEDPFQIKFVMKDIEQADSEQVSASNTNLGPIYEIFFH